MKYKVSLEQRRQPGWWCLCLSVSCFCEHHSQLSARACWKLPEENSVLDKCRLVACSAPVGAKQLHVSEGTPRGTSSSKDVVNKVWLTSICSPSRSLPRLFLKELLGKASVWLQRARLCWPRFHLAVASTTPILEGNCTFSFTPDLLCFLVCCSWLWWSRRNVSVLDLLSASSLV